MGVLQLETFEFLKGGRCTVVNFSLLIKAEKAYSVFFVFLRLKYTCESGSNMRSK